MHCARIISDMSRSSIDPEYVRNLYTPPEEAPAKSKVSWGFRHLDLAIYDAAKPVFMILKKGWN